MWYAGTCFTGNKIILPWIINLIHLLWQAPYCLPALLPGTLDSTAAVITSGKMSVFNFVASGVFGKEALDGSTNMMIYGILFHYLITYCGRSFISCYIRVLPFFRYNPMVSTCCTDWSSGYLYEPGGIAADNTPPIPFRWIICSAWSCYTDGGYWFYRWHLLLARRYYSGK